jgi:hypothetical protein
MAKARPPVEVKPGKLMTGLSAESAGVANYTLKQDFRRVLERDIRAEGYEWYRPNPIYDKLTQSLPAGSTSPISLISECGLGNGRIALIAGNQTTLWRYIGLEQPNYFDTEGGSSYFDTEGGSSYFDDGMAGWEVIGSGFSTAGRRWEAVQCGDYLVLNNGADLPMTYSLQESFVKPIYELREQQIASVGTIAVQDGILCCMDITQINDAAFLSIMSPVPAAVNATQDATGKVSPAAATLFPGIAPASLVGLTLFWAGGQTTHIDSIDGGGFIRTNASSPVADSSGLPPFTVATAAPYNLVPYGAVANQGVDIYVGVGYYALSGLIPGNTYKYVMGERTGQDYGIGNPPNYLLPGSETIVNNVPAGGASGTFVAVTDTVFLIGSSTNPTTIQIIATVSASWTPTFSAQVIASSALAVENVAAYALFNDPNSTQRHGTRFFPSMPSQPRRFGATVPVSIEYGSSIATLLFPVRSIPELVQANYKGGAETDFIITGIGAGGTNLNANVIATTPDITKMVLLDQLALTQQPFGGTENLQDQLQSSLAIIEEGDSAKSFAGVFEDLNDDDGIIIKALTLQGQLVIYKETPFIFLASYTGDLTTPFQFQKVPIQAEGAALYHRNTLIAGGGGYFGSYHIYASKNAFYKFTLFTGTPVEEPTLQACQSVFFENASDNENTFAVENPLTREIFFVFPDVNSVDTANRALCLDYAYNTARTTTAPITAAAKARHPVTRDYWFVMGLADGSLKRYGLYCGDSQSGGAITGTLAAGVVNLSAAFFTPAHVGMTLCFSGGINVAIAEYVSPRQVTAYAGNALAVPAGQTFIIKPAIWHRDGAAYNSVVQTGLDAFGFTHGEKQLNEYVLTLSSMSPNTPVNVAFVSGQNPAEGKVSQSGIIKSPNTQNLLKPTVLAYYIGVNVTVSGSLNNPLEISGHLFNIIPVSSHSFGRRPTI